MDAGKLGLRPIRFHMPRRLQSAACSTAAPVFSIRVQDEVFIPKGFAVFISNAFAQAAPAAAGSTESSLLSMLPLVLMFVVLYFVMIRPQMKRQKEHKAMIDAIAKGDEVVTSGGLLGKISKVGESYLTLEVADGVELQLQRGAVVQVLPKGTIKS